MTNDQYRREGAEAMREAIALGFVGHVRENVRRTPLPTDTTAPDAVARLVEAAKALRPYLRWTIGPESPGHHPTMPSAVDAFLIALAAMETHDD